ncbi:MAG: low temperature requirement protein A, partial [Thermoleophilaceae bacterium]
ERYGLIVIIALGESIVAIGVGAAGLELRAGEIAAATAGLAVAGAMWWTYFDVVSVVAERRLGEAAGPARARLARDSYSYLHLPLIAGVVLVALAIKKTLEHVGEPLEEAPAIALCAGVALYLLALVGFRLRVARTINVERLAAAGLALALLPVTLVAPSLVALSSLAALLAALVAYEAVRFREERGSLRAMPGHQLAGRAEGRDCALSNQEVV